MPIPKADLGSIQLQASGGGRVDTYVRPAEAPESTGMALARALQGIQPGIQQFFQQRQQKADVKDALRARKDALTHAKVEIAEVQKGELFAQESKVYQQAFKEQRGLIEGQRIRTDALVQYEQSGLTSSTDPAEFDKFLGEFLQTRLEGIEDPDILRGALGVVEQSANNLSLQHASKVSENLQTAILDDASNLVGGAMDAEMESSLREQRGFSIEAVMQTVNASNRRTQFLQLDGPSLRRRVTDMVIDKAVRYADPEVLKVLDQQMDVGGGKKIPVADGYWRSKRDEVLTRVESRQLEIGQMQERIAEKQKKAEGEQFMVELLQGGLLTSKTGIGPDDEAKIAAKFGWDTVKDLREVVTSNRTLRDYTSPEAADAALIPMFLAKKGEFGPEQLIAGMRLLRDPGAKGRYADDYRRLHGLGDGDVNAGVSKVRAQFQPLFRRFELAAQDAGAVEANALARAELEFQREMADLMVSDKYAADSIGRNKLAAERFDYWTQWAASFNQQAPTAAPAAAQAAPQASAPAGPQGALTRPTEAPAWAR